MPKYIYTARGYDGETKGGEIISKDEKTLAQQLRGEGFLVTSIKLIEDKEDDAVKVKFFDRFTKVPLKEKMVFARNLSVMISSGLTVSRAVHNLAEQTTNKKFNKILLDVYEEIQAGKALSEGMAKYPSVFNELFINMVKVGEIAGNLDEVLKIVAVQLEKEHDLVSKVRGAMIYPAVIITAMVGIGIIMLTYVLPKILGVFKDMDVELPAATKFVIGVSDFMQSHSFITFALFFGTIVFLKFFLQTNVGKQAISLVSIKLPVIKNIVIKVNCARFARIYSSLLKSGVNAVDAMKIISNTLTNYYYKQALIKGIEDVQKGVSLSKILSSNGEVFPIMVSQIAEVGEETGKTDVVLLQLAEFYEEEIDQVTKNMSSIIEPVLMIFIGGAVGFFAIAMLQPMYSLMDNIK
jgi:type IV pilus assembly protein PilC